MTNKEAIERIKEHIEIHYVKEQRAIYISEAMYMAVDALEKRTPQKPTHIHEEYPKHQWQCDEDGEIDLWAWSHNYCNGPVCERCGITVCEHCDPDYDDEECVVDEYHCPNCNKKLYKYDHKAYCDDCGQAIDWEDE